MSLIDAYTHALREDGWTVFIENRGGDLFDEWRASGEWGSHFLLCQITAKGETAIDAVWELLCAVTEVSLNGGNPRCETIFETIINGGEHGHVHENAS